MRFIRRCGALAAVFAVLGGCRPPASPEATLTRYFAHLSAGKVEAAYALTTRRYRAQHDLPTFAAAVARQPTFTPRTGGRGRETVVELAVAGNEAVVTVDRGQGPRLVVDPLDLYPNDNPEAALRSFARAVRFDRRQVVLRLLASSLRGLLFARTDDPLRAELTEAGRAIERSLAPTAGLPRGVLQQEPQGARLLLGEGHAVALALGTDGWVVSGLE